MNQTNVQFNNRLYLIFEDQLLESLLYDYIQSVNWK